MVAGTSQHLQTMACICFASLPCNDAYVLLTLGRVFAALRADVVELHLAFGCPCFQAGWWWWWWDAGLLVCPREHLPKLLLCVSVLLCVCVCVWVAEKSNTDLCYHLIDLCFAWYLVTTKIQLIEYEHYQICEAQFLIPSSVLLREKRQKRTKFNKSHLTLISVFFKPRCVPRQTLSGTGLKL